MNDALLRRVVRDKIAAGRLPRDRTGAVSATKGTDEGCGACSAPVSPKEVLVRVSHERSRTFVFHVTCFAIWRDEQNSMSAGPAILD
jgi:hypothetical protein